MRAIKAIIWPALKSCSLSFCWYGHGVLVSQDFERTIIDREYRHHGSTIWRSGLTAQGQDSFVESAVLLLSL